MHSFLIFRCKISLLCFSALKEYILRDSLNAIPCFVFLEELHTEEPAAAADLKIVVIPDN